MSNKYQELWKTVNTEKQLTEGEIKILDNYVCNAMGHGNKFVEIRNFGKEKAGIAWAEKQNMKAEIIERKDRYESSGMYDPRDTRISWNHWN